MSTFVPLLDTEQVQRLPAGAREVVEYRKSGLSLNHIQGCPLDCAYCIRHTYGLWDQRQPRALMPDAEAVERLVSHRYFQAHVTPVQLLNRATDPFLPAVRPHTLAVLADLDGRGLRNHVLVITRHQMKPSDADRLNQLVNLKVTLLFTYSGIDDKRIEPYPSQVAADSLKLMSAPGRRRYRTILYWRPLVPGLNDSDEHLARAYALQPAGRCHGLYRLVLPGSDRAVLPGQRAARTLRRHRAPEDRARDTRTASAGSLRGFSLAVPQDLVRCLLRARPARLQRSLRHPGTVRHLPGWPGQPVPQRAPGTFCGPDLPDGPRVAGSGGHTGSRHQRAGRRRVRAGR